MTGERRLGLAVPGRTVTVWPADSPKSPLVCYHAFAGDGGDVVDSARALPGCPDFGLVAVGGLEWNTDLSPWPIDRVMRRDAPYGGRASEELALVCDVVMPAAIEAAGATPAYEAIAGYSLGGLFAVWAPFECRRFSRLCSCSGSLWFPGFADYLAHREPLKPLTCAYLSLGSREAHTRHPILSTVGVRTREACERLREVGAKVTFAGEPGGHGTDPVGRMARGLATMLRA